MQVYLQVKDLSVLGTFLILSIDPHCHLGLTATSNTNAYSVYKRNIICYTEKIMSMYSLKPLLYIITFGYTRVYIRKTCPCYEKVQVGKDQEKAQSERDSHSKNRGGKKPNQQSGTYTMKHIVSRMSSYFPNRWPLSYLNLIKNMKTYIRRQQHKQFEPQDIKQKEPPQKYRLGTISNT